MTRGGPRSTAHGRAGRLADALPADVPVIDKPFDFDALLALVATHCRRPAPR